MQPLQPPKKPRSAGKVIAYIIFGFFLLMIPIALNINMESRSSDEPAVEDSSEETVPADTVAEEPEPVAEEEVVEEPAVTPELEQEYATFYDSQVRPYMDAYDSLWEQSKQVPADIGSQAISPQVGFDKLESISQEYKRLSLEVNALALPEGFPSEDQDTMASGFRSLSSAMDSRANAILFLKSEVVLIVSTNGGHQMDATMIETASERADSSLLEATANLLTVSQKYGHDPR